MTKACFEADNADYIFPSKKQQPKKKNNWLAFKRYQILPVCAHVKVGWKGWKIILSSLYVL